MENLSNVTIVKSDGQMRKQKLKTWGFYISVVALPLIQFCIFYIGVNFNSFFMAFQKFKPNSMVMESWSLENFITLYEEWVNGVTLKNALKTSLFAFGVNVLLGMTSGILFSYYIFKKMPLHGLFKVVLFMPSIISSMVMTMAYQYFMEDGIIAIAEIFGKTLEPGFMFSTESLIASKSTSIITRALLSVVLYNVWVSFGTQILMYVGAMSGIPEGTIEAGQIDGVNAIREFWHIVLPSVWSTFVVFLTAQIAVIFTNQMSLMNFGGVGVNTIGFHIFQNMERIIRKEGDYPQLTIYSSLGIVCSLIAIPITLGVRWLLTKFGPSEE